MTFQLPQLTTCCCGCSLRTGVLIIGFLNLINFLLFTIRIIVGEITWLTHGESITQIEYLETDMFEFTIVARLVLSLYLLYGCYKDNPSYIMAYFLMQVVCMLLYLILGLLYVFLHIMGVPAEEIFIYTLVTVIQGYSALIVYSHYRNLKEGRSIVS